MTGQQPKILQVAQYIAQMPVLAIEGWQTTSGLTIISLYRCSVFVKRGMLLTVHVQVDLTIRRRERTGSYPDGCGNGRSVQLVHVVVI
jgi:hypothetical protein